MPWRLRAKPRPARRPASDSRAWAVAKELRARRGWLLDNAHFHRTWSVRLGSAAFEIYSFVTLFFDGPCFIQINCTFPNAMPRATAEEVMQHLRTALGERYRGDPKRDSLVVGMRTDKPTRLLAELARVEHVLGGRAPRQFGPSPRSQDDRHWYVVEALRASSWWIYSLSFSHKVGDERGQLWPSLGVGVDSDRGQPGLNANFAGWVPRTSKRWRQFRDHAAACLTAKGFRVTEPRAEVFHAGRWLAGVNGTRALKQADEFDELLAIGADVVGG